MSGFGSLASSPVAARPVFSNSDVLVSRQLRLRMTTLPQSLSGSNESRLHFETLPPSCKLTEACFSKTHSQSVDHYLFTKAFGHKVL